MSNMIGLKQTHDTVGSVIAHCDNKVLIVLSNKYDSPQASVQRIFFFFFFFLPYHLFLHRLENRTKPISTPYDGRRWWDSNLRTPACKSPALPLCYGRRLQRICFGLSVSPRKFGCSKAKMVVQQFPLFFSRVMNVHIFTTTPTAATTATTTAVATTVTMTTRTSLSSPSSTTTMMMTTIATVTMMMATTTVTSTTTTRLTAAAIITYCFQRPISKILSGQTIKKLSVSSLFTSVIVLFT